MAKERKCKIRNKELKGQKKISDNIRQEEIRKQSF